MIISHLLQLHKMQLHSAVTHMGQERLSQGNKHLFNAQLPVQLSKAYPSRLLHEGVYLGMVRLCMSCTDNKG